MARNAAAMPQLVRMNCRRLSPSRLPWLSANSRMRRSSRFCVSLCGGGKYSPFDTIWVGIGVAAEVSAPGPRRCSRSLSQEPIVLPPSCDCGGRQRLTACGGPPILESLSAANGGFLAVGVENSAAQRRGGGDAFYRRVPAEGTHRSHHHRCGGCAGRRPPGPSPAPPGADHLP